MNAEERVTLVAEVEVNSCETVKVWFGTEEIGLE